jgi:hypothetical protein
VTANFTGMANNASPIGNPERGYAYWVGANFGGTLDTGYIATWPAAVKLGKCSIDLNPFRTTSISQGFLDTLTSNFAYMRAQGKKCYLQVFYDSNTGGADAPAAQILSHIAQLKPVIRANSDVIAFHYAGFIGRWGQWNASYYCNTWSYIDGIPGGSAAALTQPCTVATADARQVQIRDAILDMAHPQRFVLFDYPDDLIRWYPTPLSQTQAYRGGKQARSGLKNDCILSANFDTGEWNPFGRTGWTAQQQYDYAATMTLNAPYGMEDGAGSCATPYRYNCTDALAESSQRHGSVMTGPVATAFATGISACANEFDNLMGYRFILDTLSVQGSVTRGDSITAVVGLHNIGWSRVHSPYKINLVLTNGGNTITCKSRLDLRSIPPQSATVRSVAIPCLIPGGSTTGSWSVKLAMPDIWPNTASIAAHAIRPANTDSGGQTWDAANARWNTGLSITVN